MKLTTFVLLSIVLPTTALHAQSLKTDQQQVNYLFGQQIGYLLQREGVEVDMDALSSGIQDRIDDKKSRIPQVLADKILADFQKKKQAELDAFAAKKQKEGNAFLAENAKKKGIVVTDSGLQYKVLKSGKGQSPTSENSVKAHFTGKLMDGSVFYSTEEDGEPMTFPLDSVMPGWHEALLLMKEGDQWQLTIPAQLAFGRQGDGMAIGPNETLIVDMELLAVVEDDTNEKEMSAN